jgi:MscS family membrane protein
LASFIIYLDKPFKVGDSIETADISGTVENVGFRTTRLRTADKTLLTVPNRKMIDSALNNISLSEMRRVKVVLNLTYSSKTEDILGIVEDIKSAIHNHPDTTDDYVVHFTDLDASSLNVLVLYFVNGNGYEKMLRVKEEINVSLMKIVEAHHCEFAYPTQTVIIQK